jgi:uncharacterized membrane protein
MNVPFALRAAGIGFVAGLRSMTAPAAVMAATDNPLALPGVLLALGELVGDKLPMTPSRTIPPAFGVRVLSGGYCGFALAEPYDGSMLIGVAGGAAGAVAGTLAGAAWREKVAPALHVPSIVAALLEDALAVGAALALTGLE